MTTSGTYSFTVSLSDIIRESMLNVGAIGEAEVPTSQEFTDCQRKLNMMVKQWMGKQDFAPGLKMWTRQRATLFLGANKHQYQLGPNGDNWAAFVTGGSVGQTHNMTQLTANLPAGSFTLPLTSTALINVNDFIGIQYNPGQGSPGSDLFWTQASTPVGNTVNIAVPLPGTASVNAYVFNYSVKGQRPLNIETSILRDVYGDDVPQTVMTLQDYENLPAKVQPNNQSDPTSFYYESQIGTGYGQTAGSGQYYIDCYGAQDVTKHLHIVYLRPVQDFDNSADNPEYPQQWYRALCWGLAREIAGMFDCPWTKDMDDNYHEAMAMAKEADAEVTSFYFQVNAGSPYDP